jgi:hypothetical protein
LARSRGKGYNKLLLGKETVSTDTEFEGISDATEKKKAKELRDLNKLAYEDLILSIDGKKDYGRVALIL